MMFLPKRDEQMRKLHNERFQHMYASSKYYSGDEVMEDEMNGTCDMCGR
jgi:hypothetical protein